MGLPKQIRDQIAEADRIAEEMKAKSGQSEPEQDADQDGKPAPVAEASFSSEPADADDVSANDGTPGDDEGQPQGDGEDENSPTYKQRWKSLDGMVAAERRRNAELSSRVEALEGMLANIQNLHKQQQPQASKQDKEQDAAVRQLLTPEEIEDYGSDLIDVMKRAAREAVRDEIDGLKQENSKLKSLIGGVGQKQDQSDREKLYARLDTDVQNWRDINRDPDFLAWLDELDVYAGEPRRALLSRAFTANDATRVGRFFKGFLKETAAVQNAAAPAPEPSQTQPKAGSGKVPLESMAAPGVGSSGSADKTSQQQGRMIKESEIGAFYEAARKGQFKGRDAEYRKTEQEIQAALNEGRILLGR